MQVDCCCDTQINGCAKSDFEVWHPKRLSTRPEVMYPTRQTGQSLLNKECNAVVLRS